MNVKCPNCRFRFDVTPTDINDNNEVNCTCPRCGSAFTSKYIASSSNHPFEEPVPSINAQVPPVVSEEEEADLYYAVMKRMKAGQHEEAGVYLKKLLALKPDEPIYKDIKEQLDKIKQSYLLATKYISSGQFDLAEQYVNDLLQVNPKEPMFLSLKKSLDEVKLIEAQRQEELRQQQEAGKEEEKRLEVRLKKQQESESKQKENQNPSVLNEQPQPKAKEKSVNVERDNDKHNHILKITLWIIAGLIIVLVIVSNCDRMWYEKKTPERAVPEHQLSIPDSQLSVTQDQIKLIMAEREKVRKELEELRELRLRQVNPIDDEARNNYEELNKKLLVRLNQLEVNLRDLRKDEEKRRQEAASRDSY